MGSAPFRKPPVLSFALRVLAPAAFAFGLGIVLLGEAVTEPMIRREFPKLEAFRMTDRVGGWMAAERHLQRLGAAMAEIPDPCRTGNTVSDFQAAQCREIRNGMLVAWGMLLIPPGLVALVVFLAWDSLSLLYRKARRRIESGNGAFMATVTEPPTLPTDVFAWAHCLRCLSVELSNRQQVKVYAPISEPLPEPGEKVAAFDCGTHFGHKRFVVVPYRPHVTVVRGT